MLNQNKESSLFQFTYSLLQLTAFFAFVFVFIGNSVMVSLMFKATVLILCLVLFSSLNKDLSINKFLISSFCIIFLALSFLVVGDYSSDFFDKLLLIYVLIIVMTVNGYTKINSINYKLMECFCIALSVIIILFSFFIKSNVIAGGVTMNFDNPNATGLFIISNGLYLLAFARRSKIYKKIIFIVLYSFQIYGAFLTASRTSFVLMIIALVLFFFRFKKNTKFTKLTLVLLYCLPLIFSLSYVFIYRANIFPDDYLIFNKLLFSGRQTIWANIIDSMSKSLIVFLFGSFSVGQAHNTAMDLLLCYGVVGYILVSILFLKYIFYLNNKKTNNSKYILLLFMVLLLTGLSEAAVITGFLTMFIYIGNFAQIINYESDVENPL